MLLNNKRLLAPLAVALSPRRSALRLAAVGAVALLVAAAAGCGSSGDQNQDPRDFPGVDAGDTGVDPGNDSGSEGDASDGGGDTGSPVDTGIPTNCTPAAEPQTVSEGTEIEVSGWRFGTPNDEGNGEMISELRSGDFEFPDAFAYGTAWEDTDQNDDGEIDISEVSGQGTVGYLVATVEVSEPTVVAAETDDFRRLYVNNTAHPGGIYGHGDKMQPVALEAGTNELVIQFVNSRNNAPKLRLVDTPEPIAFNPQDQTSPELRVGRDTEQPLGLPVLNLSGRTLKDVEARVLENEFFEATTVEQPFLAPDAVTQLAFDLKPKSAWSEAGREIPVRVAVASCGTEAAFETTIQLQTVESGAAFRKTFRSPVDDSVQYYGVLPPSNFDSSKEYGLVLTLHGASVEAKGQATAYSKKEDLYIVAPTNRRRFGFDWEEWGKFNGMRSLDHAMEEFNIDPTSVYLTGHSMGGHGTWHLGVMHPGRFATIGPSAGWESVYTYPTVSDKPSGAIRRARAHSETSRYLSNLADRGAYIIHGGADNNVPTEQGRTMRDKLKEHTDDVTYHEEPGAGHWWDRDDIPGAATVNWPPLFEFFDNHQLDPNELDFQFISPGPWYSDEHSYVRVRSSATPMEDFELDSTTDGSDRVVLQTQNVRSMEIDGDALQEKGIATIEIDGMPRSVESGTMTIGPESGKKPGANGTFNQVLREPFCFVYPPGEPFYRRLASFHVSNWSFQGNGHACALPSTQLDDEIRSERHLVYLGVDFERIPDHEQRPFGWSDSTVSVGPNSYDGGVLQVAFPSGDGLAGAMVATDGSESQLFRLQPFSSRNGMPDYLGLDSSGGLAIGFFDNQWEYDSSLGVAR